MADEKTLFLTELKELLAKYSKIALHLSEQIAINKNRLNNLYCQALSI